MGSLRIGISSFVVPNMLVRFFVSVIVCVILLVGRIGISGQGYLEDPDEMPYIMTHILSGHFHELSSWLRLMTEMETSPIEAAIRLGQYKLAGIYAAYIGVSPLHTKALIVPGFFNILVSLLQLLVFYRIATRLGFDWSTAITGALLLGTLVNYNIYTRHILPYDHSLLAHLITLYLFIGPKFHSRHILIGGICTALALTSYLGHFMFAGINGMLLLVRLSTTEKSIIRSLILFGSPLLILIASYEVIAQIGGKSYIDTVLAYGKTIVNGSHEEGLTFVLIYFIQVEGLWGLLMLVMCFSGIVLTILNHRTKFLTLRNALITSVLAYLIFGSVVYFFHQFMFYGRVLHMYMPFIVLGVLGVVHTVNSKWRATLCVVLSIASVVNYAFNVENLNNLGYPRSIINMYGLCVNNKDVQIQHKYEMMVGLDYGQGYQWRIDTICLPSISAGNYTIVNGGFLKDYPDDFLLSYNPIVPPTGSNLIIDKLHFQSHPAYGFEYCTKYGRQFFLTHKFRLRTYQLKPNTHNCNSLSDTVQSL